MFHHTHTYLACQLYNDEVPELQFGSILPDLAVTGIIDWETGLHGAENDQKFYDFIQQNYPEYIQLANGVHAHNIVDDITHLSYKGKEGYAYQRNKQLTELIEMFYDLQPENAEGKAHNYIESGVDILLLKEFPEIQTKFRLAINQLNQDKIAKILSEYFHKDPQKIKVAITQFIELFTKYDFQIQEEWILFWQDLEKLIKLKNIGNGKRTQLINKSIEITKPSYKEFIEYAKNYGRTKLLDPSA